MSYIRFIRDDLTAFPELRIICRLIFITRGRISKHYIDYTPYELSNFDWNMFNV